MRFNELKQSLNNGERFSVYVLEGEDAYFRELSLETIKNSLIREPTINVAVFEGDQDKNGIMASLAAIPFLSEYRLTVIKEYYPKNSVFTGGIQKFFEEPVKKSLLIIVNEKPFDLFKKYPNACIVACDFADASIIAKWVKTTVKNSGLEISDNAAKSVAEYCLSDMSRVKNETEKLIAFSLDKKEITLSDVDLLVYRDSEYKIYEMTDHIAKKRFDLAIGIINEMLNKGDTPAKIISSVYGYFRRLLFSAISDKGNAETATLLGVKEYAAKKLREQASAFKIRSLKSAVDRLSDADYAIKTGKYSADDLMWINIFKIMTD